MKQEQFFVKSPCDGLNLSTLTVLPQLPEKAEGIVQLIHGMAEHKERYLHFMEFLAAHGYICIIHDHRGHGKSVKSSADLGYFYGQGSDGLVEDTAAVTRYARSRWPNLPVFLIGHSMGSLIARAYTKKYDDQIERLILIGSPSEKGGARIAGADKADEDSPGRTPRQSSDRQTGGTPRKRQDVPVPSQLDLFSRIGRESL